jgi:hypothetical protein
MAGGNTLNVQREHFANFMKLGMLMFVVANVVGSTIQITTYRSPSSPPSRRPASSSTRYAPP